MTCSSAINSLAAPDKASSPLTRKATLVLRCQTRYLTFIDSYVAPFSLEIRVVRLITHGRVCRAGVRLGFVFLRLRENQKKHPVVLA